jgi:hypothetical protein
VVCGLTPAGRSLAAALSRVHDLPECNRVARPPKAPRPVLPVGEHRRVPPRGLLRDAGGVLSQRGACSPQIPAFTTRIGARRCFRPRSTRRCGR